MKIRKLKSWHTTHMRRPFRMMRRIRDLPKAKRAELVTGQIGRIYHMNLITD